MGYQSFDLADSAARVYADSLVNQADQKKSVRAVATGNVTLTGAYTVDGVTLVNGDRYLAPAQSTPSQNGIYVYNSAGAHARASDADTSAEVTAGMLVPVAEGTLHADTVWELTTNDPITLGTTPLTFSKISSVALLQQLVDHIASTSNPHSTTALQVGEYAWVWNDADARTNQAVSAGDVNKKGWQADIRLEYQLISISPSIWVSREDPNQIPYVSWTSTIAGTTATMLGATLTFGGTGTARTPSAASVGESLIRTGYVSAASINSLTNYRAVIPATIPHRATLRGVWVPGVSTAARYFLGEGWSTNFGASADILGWVSCWGVAKMDGFANLQFVHNNGAGNAVLHDLGGSFVANTDKLPLEVRLAYFGGTSWAINICNMANRAEKSFGPGIITKLPDGTFNNVIGLHSDTSSDAVAISVDVANGQIFQLQR